MLMWWDCYILGSRSQHPLRYCPPQFARIQLSSYMYSSEKFISQTMYRWAKTNVLSTSLAWWYFFPSKVFVQLPYPLFSAYLGYQIVRHHGFVLMEERYWMNSRRGWCPWWQRIFRLRLCCFLLLRSRRSRIIAGCAVPIFSAFVTKKSVILQTQIEVKYKILA